MNFWYTQEYLTCTLKKYQIFNIFDICKLLKCLEISGSIMKNLEIGKSFAEKLSTWVIIRETAVQNYKYSKKVL